LGQEAKITLPDVKRRYFSTDGSVRYLFGLRESGDEAADGKKKPAASVESVFMPSEGRQTICISSQAGCAVDCRCGFGWPRRRLSWASSPAGGPSRGPRSARPAAGGRWPAVP